MNKKTLRKFALSLIGISSSAVSIAYAVDEIQLLTTTPAQSADVRLIDASRDRSKDEGHAVFSNIPTLKNTRFYGVQNLQSLEISSCPQITGSVFCTIAKSSPNLRALKLNDLSRHRMLCARTLFSKPMDQAIVFAQLEELHISNQASLGTMADGIPGIHIDAPKLKSLVIRDCANLVSFKISSTNLETIDLSGNTRLHFNSVWHFLYQQNQRPALTNSENWVNTPGIHHFAQHPNKDFKFIVTLMPLKDELREIMLSVYEDRAGVTLDFTQRGLGATGALSLAKALLTNTTLTSLILKSNNLYKSDISALITALKSNFTLTKFIIEEPYTYQYKVGTGRYEYSPGPHGDGDRSEIMATHTGYGDRVTYEDRDAIRKLLIRNTKESSN